MIKHLVYHSLLATKKRRMKREALDEIQICLLIAFLNELVPYCHNLEFCQYLCRTFGLLQRGWFVFVFSLSICPRILCLVMFLHYGLDLILMFTQILDETLVFLR